MAKTTGNVNPRAASGYMNPKAAGNKSAAKPKAATKVKVSQATIDHIKKIGMTKALKEIQALGQQSRMAPGNKKYATMREGGKELLAGEFATGVKRMYGERRFSAASGPKPKAASTKYSPAPFKKPKPKSSGAGSSKVK